LKWREERGSEGGGKIAQKNGNPRGEGEAEKDRAVAWARKGSKKGGREGRRERGRGRKIFS
jgi:hypothetical protein